MLPKKVRLPSTKIPLILKRGTRIKGRWLELFVCQQGGLEDPKIAILVPNRIDKRASARNRFKRQIREMIKKKIGEVKSDTEIVIMLRAPKEWSYQGAESELGKLLERGGLIKSP